VGVFTIYRRLNCSVCIGWEGAKRMQKRGVRSFILGVISLTNFLECCYYPILLCSGPSGPEYINGSCRSSSFFVIHHSSLTTTKQATPPRS